MEDPELELLLKKSGAAQSKAKFDVRKLARGVGTTLCITAAVVSWVTMAQLLRDVDSTYNKPFFQAYLIHAFYAVFYVGWKLWMVFPGNKKASEGTLTNFKHLAIATAVLGLISYLSGAFWYLSLPITSLSANTSVYQSASAVVFIFSVPVLRERVSVLKVLSVGLTIIGVTLISVFAHDKTKTTAYSNVTMVEDSEAGESATGRPIGYVYLALSTILYAMMEVGFKKFATAPDDTATVQNSVRGLGYMGVNTLLFIWPLLVLLHFTALESFMLPDLETLKHLVVNIFLDLIFNVSLLVAIALSSPLLTTVGTVLVIPASVLVDWLLHGYILPWQAILGILWILMGFFGLVFSESVEKFFWYRNSSALEMTEKSLNQSISINTTLNAKHKTTPSSRKQRILRYFI